MRKDRLVLVLLLTMFALLGAECRLIGVKDDDEEKRLPNRALAASPLLRTYYDTLSTPSGMTDLKIPEDKDMLDEDGPLEVQFDMGGSAVITDVRARIRVAPPAGVSIEDCEIQARIVSPNGTAGPWKSIDMLNSQMDRTQAEVVFLNEFDGLISDGRWTLELRDAVDDNDGRCVFRNATLRLNLGEAAPGGAANETQTLPLTSTSYTSMPEVRGVRDEYDWGHFGMGAVLQAQFTFTTSFTVRGFSLTLNILFDDGSQLDGDLVVGLIAPSGGWMLMAHDFTGASTGAAPFSEKWTLSTFTVAESTTTYLAESFPLRGEPSAGTWTVVVWDLSQDQNIMLLQKDAAVGVAVVPDTPISLTLTGVS